MNELFDKQYNKSAVTFNDLYLDQQAHVSTEDFFDVFKKLIPKKQNSKLLDLGCGAGADFTFYTKEGFECAGIDASLQMCNLAKKIMYVQMLGMKAFLKKPHLMKSLLMLSYQNMPCKQHGTLNLSIKKLR